jgi:hypothetical protein
MKFSEMFLCRPPVVPSSFGSELVSKRIVELAIQALMPRCFAASTESLHSPPGYPVHIDYRDRHLLVCTKIFFGYTSVAKLFATDFEPVMLAMKCTVVYNAVQSCE